MVGTRGLRGIYEQVDGDLRTQRQSSGLNDLTSRTGLPQRRHGTSEAIQPSPLGSSDARKRRPIPGSSGTKASLSGGLFYCVATFFWIDHDDSAITKGPDVIDRTLIRRSRDRDVSREPWRFSP
jgi:hypothetical protein